MMTEQATSKTTEIKLAHSPDSDDAFMFYALATNRVKTPGLKFATNAHVSGERALQVLDYQVGV